MSKTKDLQALYRETVLEHSRQPHNFARFDEADRVAVGHNPLCGDKITVYLGLDEDRIEKLSFEGTGCAISIASASIMTEAVSDRSLEDAQREVKTVLRQLDPEQAEPAALSGDMAALSGVRDYPSRVKCATLAWKTLEAALHERQATATTES